jgi:hypothetical protein
VGRRNRISFGLCARTTIPTRNRSRSTDLIRGRIALAFKIVVLHERGAAKDVILPLCEGFGAHENGRIKPHLVLER